MTGWQTKHIFKYIEKKNVMIHVIKAVLGGTMSFWLNTTGSLYVCEYLQDVI